MDSPPFIASLSRRPWLVFLLSALVALFFLFVHPPNQTLVTMDARPCSFLDSQDALKKGVPGFWSTENWLGQGPITVSPGLNALILGWVPFPYSSNLSFSFHLLVGGVGMYFLLRTLGLGGIASIFGGMAYLFTNNGITSVFPGHVHRFMTCAWFPWSLAAFLVALRQQKLLFYVAAGGFLGLAFLPGEVQLCYYLGLWYMVWVLLDLHRRRKESSLSLRDILISVGGLALVAVVSLGLGIHTTLSSFNFLQTQTPVTGATDSPQNWHFATQYFFPPEEILSYITTVQFFGGPSVYWGRDGAPTPLRLSDDYMGLLPLGFAILGGITCWRMWQARFFVIMALGSLFASFGRDGLLYSLLYQLPTMKFQRNPHRWSYFVAVAVCVLAAYGVHWLRQRNAAEMESATKGQRWRFWRRVLLAATLGGVGLCLLARLLLFFPQVVSSAFFDATVLASPQGGLLVERIRQSLVSLLRTGCFLALSSACVLWVFHDHTRFRLPHLRWQTGISWAVLILVMTLDLGFNAKRYFRLYEWKEIYSRNDLANFLKSDPDKFRVKVFNPQQNNFLNDLVTNILPYHSVPVVDPPAVSRMPQDYATFFDYTREHYVRFDRYLDFFNVKYLVSAGPFMDPNVSSELVAKMEDIHVYRRPHFLPRAWLASSAWVERGSSDKVLFHTLHPGINLRDTAVLQDRPSLVPLLTALPPPSIPSPSGAAESSKGGGSSKGKKSSPEIAAPAALLPSSDGRSAHITHYEDHSLTVETVSSAPSLLVMGEKWDPDWKAWVDDRPAPILKANFLMRAVELPAGRHVVRMVYQPSKGGFWASATLSILFALGCLVAGLRWCRKACSGS